VYQRIAGFALPLVAAALVWFAYLDHRHRVAEAAAADDASGVARFDPSSTDNTRAMFAHIYDAAAWGSGSAGQGTSGAGSTAPATMLYRAYLQQFLADHHIKSVVDAGCGDWEFSHTVDWTGIDYQGFDIVDSVIAGDKAKYEAPNVHFTAANIVETDLPPADLLIVKHVLQHLPNADVQKFLAKQLGKYKYALITNGIEARTLTSPNRDVALGGYRPLDITQPPFGVAGMKVLTYWAADAMHQVVLVTK
jgi:SAM-dependent methyltransferase